MKPNVVMMVSDQHQAKVTGCYGNKKVQTPNIDKLAARGVLFSHAYCDSPLCAPSRASMITGVMPCTHKAIYHTEKANPKIREGIYGIPDIDTLGTVFRKNGYRTAAIGKLHVNGETPDRDLGFDIIKHSMYTRGFKEYIEAVGMERKRLYNGETHDGIRTAESIHNYDYKALEMDEKYNQDSLTVNSSLEFIEENADEPFFIFVGLDKPHPPWILQKNWMDMYNPEDMDLPLTLREQEEKGSKDFLRKFQQQVTHGLSDERVRNSIAAYYATITNMDFNLGRVVKKVEELGLMENTIFIYTTDHGELLFEHGTRQKHCCYESAVRVPLVFSFPCKLPDSKVCDQPAALIDLFPTLLELCEIQGNPDILDGESLYGYMTGEKTINRQKEVYSEFHEENEGFHDRTIIKGEWKYIYTIVAGEEKTEQLYNLKVDPDEINNLAYEKEYRIIREELREKVLDEAFVSTLKQ